MNKNSLEQLQTMSVIVVDTGEIERICEFSPEDATTNPSLILNAAKQNKYRKLIFDGIASAKKETGDLTENAADFVAVNFGKEILKHIPGLVSTEVDAELSFDTEKTIEKAERLIVLYRMAEIDPARILIKIAATWEGIQAMKVLEKKGIRCNMTLIFSLEQAIACAKNGAFLISPFVGRILDWHKKDTGKEFSAQEDPGVLSVRKIYDYYKQFACKTVVMGASFRNVEEILELAGCDRLTISPKLMEELRSQTGKTLERKLSPDFVENRCSRLEFNEKTFRSEMNENAMATEKLSEGIRNFVADTRKLKKMIQEIVAL